MISRSKIVMFVFYVVSHVVKLDLTNVNVVVFVIVKNVKTIISNLFSDL